MFGVSKENTQKEHENTHTKDIPMKENNEDKGTSMDKCSHEQTLEYKEV